MKGKIGCFGRSIGGTIATHLANSYPEYVEFLFIDRSLGSLEVMSESSFLGSCSRKILSHFSQNWVLNSDRNFFETKCFKILTQDPQDSIVDQYCALNAQVAKLACNSILGPSHLYNARHSLNPERGFSALRLLFLIEAKLNLQIKKSPRKKSSGTAGTGANGAQGFKRLSKSVIGKLMAIDMGAKRSGAADEEDAAIQNQKKDCVAKNANDENVVIDLGNGAMIMVEEKEKKVDYGVILNRYTLRDADES